ncbi:hypothetical protein DL93DRAFT_2061853 [Clavulina sp. PMI_390]|nr:hypothetical protein DL93DRAFT_2061853 [Clavulina sp. PMI_390]
MTAASSTSPSSNIAKLFTGGQGTSFYPSFGTCGWTNSSSDYVVAMSASRYTSSACGQIVSITANGKTHTAEVVDECPCCSTNSFEMSPALFRYFTNKSVGTISIQWKV